MQEIIHIQVGRCGNAIGQLFWETILDEHHLNPTGTYTGTSDEFTHHRLNTYFSETTGFRYMPRSVFVDLEPGILDSIRAGKLGRLFKQTNFVSGQYGAGCNWVKAFYTEGAELAEIALDAIRKETEACDSLQGFQFAHSLGGGTGSGMGSLLMSKLKEEYPSKMLQSFSVFPSKKVSDVITEPYNAMLAMTELIDSADMVHAIDNEALYSICFRTLKLTSPTYSDLNNIVSRALSGITCSLRFKGDLNSDLRRFTSNMVPFPKLHFLITSIAPLSYRGTQNYRHYTVPELAQSLYDAKNVICEADPRHGRYLTMTTIYRGKASPFDVDQQYFNVANKNSSYYIEWIPNNCKRVIYKIPEKNFAISGLQIGNSTAVQESFRSLIEEFHSIFKKKTLLHWYTDEGLDEMDFIAAESKVDEMMNEYQFMQDATADDDDFYEEEEGY